jgi:hypothetical protein
MSGEFGACVGESGDLGCRSVGVSPTRKFRPWLTYPIDNGAVSAYSPFHAGFTDKELVDLAMAVITINGWNRLAIAFNPDVDVYQTRQTARSAG